MSAAHLPDDLIEYMASGLCLPWCGAGISVGSGLPGWGHLVEALMRSVERNLNDGQIAELRALAARGHDEDVVDYCRDSLGEGEYRDFLARTLGAGAPNRVHRAVVQLPVSTVLTTNYDRLLETAAVLAKGTLPRVLTAQDSQALWKQMAKREFFILKVHGDIARPDTLVFTSRDYTSHVFGNLLFMSFMQRLMLSHAILFIGSSLTDIYIRRILEETSYMTKGVGLPHFALLPNVGSVQSRILRDRYNIRVISYDPGPKNEHEPHILEALAGLTDRSAAYNMEFRALPKTLREELIKLFCTVFYDPSRIRMIAEALGLPPWAVNWDMAAVIVWEQVLTLATRERRLVALFDAVIEKAPAIREPSRELLAKVEEWETGGEDAGASQPRGAEDDRSRTGG